MKNLIFTFIGLLLLFFGGISNNKLVAQESPTSENSISIISTPDLFNLTTDWASEFCKLNPETKIKVVKFTDANQSSILETGTNLYFVSNEAYSSLNNKELWKLEVGKDALVPIINSKNPFLADIKKQNISPEILAQVLVNPANRIWTILPKTGKKVPVNYYLVNNQSDKSMIGKYLSTNQTIEGIGLENYDQMISAIQNDPYSIGFCKMSSLIKSNNDQNITMMPVDKNGNGQIDGFENIYTDLQAYKRNAWIEKYPKELTANIYSIAPKMPVNQAEIAFLKWVSTDGQQLLNQKGYASLVYKEKQSNLTLLGYNKTHVANSKDLSVFSKIANFFSSISLSVYVFVSFIVSLIVIFILMFATSKDKSLADSPTHTLGVFDENSLIVPVGLFFDKTHTWAFMEKNGMVRIGIDDFIQHITGPLTKVKMKNPGDKVKKGEPILTIIQNGKQLNINSPVSGTIRSQNEILSKEPSTINQSPYTIGWVYMVEPTNWLREIQFYLMAEKYQEWIKYEFWRLKDFLAITLNAKMPTLAPVVLQDGGVIRDNVLADLGPEVWEEFQINFVDMMK